MKYYYKLFLWKDGKLGEELTKYLTAPIYIETRLSEIGTAKFILDGVPTALYGKPFVPKTKMRLLRSTVEDFTDNKEPFDYIIDTDNMEIYQGCPKLCRHEITLYEPLIVTQDWHVDNISTTRQLKDITLAYSTIIVDEKEKIDLYISSITDDSAVGYSRSGLQYGYSDKEFDWFLHLDDKQTFWTLYCDEVKFNATSTANFQNTFSYEWQGLEELQQLVKNLNGLESKEISFNVPICKYKMLRGSRYIDLFDLPTKTYLVKQKIRKNIINNIEYQDEILEEFPPILLNAYSPALESVENPIDNFPKDTDIERSKLKMDKASAYRIIDKDGQKLLCMLDYKNKRTTNMMVYGSNIVWMDKRDIPVFELYGKNQTSVQNVPEIDLKTAAINFSKAQTNRAVTFPTDKLSSEELKDNIQYRYIIKTEVTLEPAGKVVRSVSAKAVTWHDIAFGGERLSCDVEAYTVDMKAASIYVEGVFYSKDCKIAAKKTTPYLKKPAKYSLYKLLRKAMLTIDTQIIDMTKHGLDPLFENGKDIGIQYPLVMNTEVGDLLNNTIVHDSIFEGRNFLEILLQIGKYIHATPKLKFASDGTDRYELYFLKLGDTREQNNKSNKITVYNSQALSEYYTQFDSYVQNLFSSQNSITEFLVPKTSASTYLITNDTAELQTKYNILEIMEFSISDDGINYKSAIDYIFEKSIYDTLPSDPDVMPSKGNSLFYILGSNKIEGVNYVPPNDGKIQYKASLKSICKKVLNLDNVDNLNYNELSFKIKYRTQDSLRLAQFKPNLSDFVKDNAYESYPHNEQFYNQQDKVIDSEKFSGNLWGQLIKAANETYICNEYCTPRTEREVGQLVYIKNEIYYITAIDAEYYNEAILQKVYYSKNYNNFSAITSIPCEPRFYEISERSNVRRETRQFDFFELTDNIDNYKKNTSYYIPNWQDYIKKLIFCEDNENAEIPNYVYVKFLADSFRKHISEVNEKEDIPVNELFPSCETIRENGVINALGNSDSRGVIVPVLHYPLKNSILFEWDMMDNFKAGDAINRDVSGENETGKDRYYSMQSARYCDVFGGADLMQFIMFYKDGFTREQLQRLPFAEEKNGEGKEDFIPKEEDRIFGIGGKYAIGLDKDNREAISGNFQIVLLNKAKNNRNGFVLINTVFNKKNGRLKLALRNDSVPIIPQALDMSDNKIIRDNIPYILKNTEGYITVEIDKNIAEEELSKVQSLVWYDEETEATSNITTKIPYIAKNLATVANEEKLDDLYIISIYGKGE